MSCAASVLALYQIVHYAGGATGQQAIRLHRRPSSYVPFSIVACALALSVLPLAYTRSDPPEPPPVPRLRLAWLFRISPVGVVGALVSGIANGTFWSLAPVFAERSGLSRRRRRELHDRGDRRRRAGAMAGRPPRRPQRPPPHHAGRDLHRGRRAGRAGVVRARATPSVLIALAALVGASALVLYPLASSHAQDLGGRENAVEVSTGLLLAYTIGAIVGPTTAAWLMGWIGPQALFIHNSAIHVAFVVYIVWRLWRRPPRARGEGVSARPRCWSRTRRSRRATAMRSPRPCSRRRTRRAARC